MHTLWESRGPWARLVVALAAVAAGVLLRLSLLDVIGPRTPFVTFYPAATVAALLGGLISGGAATVLLGLVAYFWVLPQLSPYILSNAGWLALSVFVVTGVLISVITEVMHRARRRAALAEAEAALSAQRCELDAAIQRLAAIVESSDDAIIGASMDGTITSWNLGAQRIYGYTPEEAIGKSAAGLMAPPDRPGEIAQVLERIASGQHVRNFETQRRRKDGSLVDVSVTLSPIRSSDCSLAGVSAVVRDITERRRAEQALRESEVFSRTIVESSPDCIKLLNAAGELTYISQGGLRLLEMECSEGVLGRPYTEFWKGSDLAAVETALAEARAGRLGRFEGFCPTASGTPKWWDVSIAPMPGPGGAIERFLVVSRDDTARRQAVEALRESEERFRQLVEHAPDGIFVQTQGRFAYVNRACLALYGAAEPGQLLGQAVPTRVHPDFADQARERIRVLNEERRGVPALEMRHLRLDGSTVDVEVSAEPLVYGGQPGALVFLRDISERKRLESLREDMERIARHDLKTPLNAVINLPLLMLDEGGLSEEQASMLRMVHEAGLRMLDQIDQSLTLYRIETRSFELDPQPVDLPDLLIRVARDLSTLAQGLGVDLALDLGPGPVCARGDVLLCRTMFANLIKNAVEAAGRGGRASVRLEAGSGWASVAVHNPGAVPKSLRGGFFEKYASVGKRRGAGLGTYSARLSAEAQGGSIAMETGEEQGTTITVRLPLWPGEGDAA